jgi:hypothetical protein
VEQIDPCFSILPPPPDLLDTGEGGFAHALMEAGIVGELLETGCDCFGRADGDDEPFHAVGE